MSVLLKLTGTNMFGGTEVIYCGSRILAESGLSTLDFFNSKSEYFAVSVKCEVIQQPW